MVYYPVAIPRLDRGFFINMNNQNKLQLDLNSIHPTQRKEIEELVVNTVKTKIIKKFEAILEMEGKSNIRKLFLAPVFTIVELNQRVQKQAPELLTVYFKELFTALDEAGQKLS